MFFFAKKARQGLYRMPLVLYNELSFNRLNDRGFKMARRIGNPTIKDVAQACGVSEATVSYVINGTRVLKDETRERVRRAMQEMNYQPSAVARGLSTKSLHTLGVLLGAVNPVDFMVNHYAAGVLQGVVMRAQQDRFNVTLFTETWHNGGSASALRDGRCDGILVIGPRLESDVLDCLWSNKVPTVAVSAVTSAPIPVVDVDDFLGARLATKHLIGLGHRRIVHLAGNTDLASHKPRREGFLATLREADLDDPTLQQVVVSDFNGSLAFEQTTELLRSQNPPTAIFAGNDTIALVVIDAARAAGLDVPQDLSVVGYDDMRAATLVTPGLTTIWQPLVDIGMRATSLLIEQVQDPSAKVSDNLVLLAPELIVRGTTAPLREPRAGLLADNAFAIAN